MDPFRAMTEPPQPPAVLAGSLSLAITFRAGRANRPRLPIHVVPHHHPVLGGHHH
ncbi:MAG: hypothetical protein WCI75_00510 [candidate division NC10 bacterium]